MGNQLTEKIQVLISKEDLKKLNSIILNNALDEGTRPESLSTYVRNLIRLSITDYQTEKEKKQESYLKNDLKDLKKEN